ncbi:hypothetical protein [Amycolatopsis sp. NPDC001319]|uniref:hypothetical protein n=1 Tax=unclassified Amycolatopsis TaxID=2618356 RepID=UPI003696F4A2
MSGKVPHLGDISDAFRREVDEIEIAFASSNSCDHVTQFSMQYAPHVDGCVVSLWDAWNRFLRAVVMASAAGKISGYSKVAYQPSTVLSENGVLAFLAANKKQLGVRLIDGEPNWYNVKQLASIASGLGLQNASQIVGSIGASSISLGASGSISNPIEDVRLVRNYIAHKTKSKMAEVQRLSGFVPNGHVTLYLWSKSSGGVERFSNWITALKAVADSCCS